jgi:prepilin-type N-terminal cleavage/methylation domain-containing protein
MVRRRGLTLLEVVLSTAVLSVVLLGTFSAMAHAARADALSRERDAATRQALLELDDRSAAIVTPASFDAELVDPPLDVAFDVLVETARGVRTPLPPAARGHASGRVGRLTATPVRDGTYDGKVHLVELKASVRWRAADGQDAQVVLSAWKVRPLE